MTFLPHSSSRFSLTSSVEVFGFNVRIQTPSACKSDDNERINCGQLCKAKLFHRDRFSLFKRIQYAHF